MKFYVIIESDNDRSEERRNSLKDANEYACAYWEHLSKHDRKRYTIWVGFCNNLQDPEDFYFDGFDYDENCFNSEIYKIAEKMIEYSYCSDYNIFPEDFNTSKFCYWIKYITGREENGDDIELFAINYDQDYIKDYQFSFNGSCYEKTKE